MQRDAPPYLVTASYDLSVSFVPLLRDYSWRPPRIAYPHSQINRIATSSDNRLAVAANPNIVVYEFATSSWKPYPHAGHQGNVSDLIFVGGDLFSCSEDHTWLGWDRKSMRASLRGTGSAPLNAVAAQGSGQILITADEKGQIERWDIRATERPLSVRKVGQSPVRSIALSRDGARLIAGCHDGKLWTVTLCEGDFGEMNAFQAHQEPLLRVMIAPDEATFVTTSADSSACLWDFGDCSLKFRLKEAGQEKWVWDAVYGPTGECVCTVGTDRWLRVWNCQTGECVQRTNELHQKGIIACSLWNAPK